MTLGLGRIYFSIISWNEDERIISRYKMCKIWEMLFESMPSIGLSTYAIIVNYDTNNSNLSILLSMIFSFINITNTIVTLLTTDNDKIRILRNNINAVDIINTNSNTNTHTRVSIDDKAHGNCNLEMVSSKSSVSPDVDLELELDIGSKVNVNVTDSKTTMNNNNYDVSGVSYWISDETQAIREIKFFQEELYIPNLDLKPRKSKKSCIKLPWQSCMCKCEINKMLKFIILIFLSSDLFLKMLSLLFIVVFINNYDNDSSYSIANRMIICLIFVCSICVLEYFCFQYLVAKDKFKFIFAAKYFLVCTFTISFYFLIFVGLTYLPKIIEKNKFIKYQTFKIILSILFVLFVLVLQLWVDTQIIANTFFALFFGVLVVHVLSFIYLNKIMLTIL